MANDLVSGIYNSLVSGNNKPGLAAPIFSYPGATKVTPGAPTPLVNSQVSDGQRQIDNSRAMYDALMKQIQALSAPKPFTYSNFDVVGNSARARAQAESAVNPYYQKLISDFIARQQVEQQRGQADVATSQQQLDQALKTVQEANATAGLRTTQDTQNVVDTTNNQIQNFQQDTGQAFDQARNTLAGQVAKSGLTTSGLGANQAQSAVNARNTAESRQVQAFNKVKEQAQIAKTRTYEDIATSNANAQRTNEQGKTATTLNYNRFLEDQQYALAQERNAQERLRQADIATQTQQYAKAGVNQFLNTLSGQNRANTQQIYGNIY